MILELLNKCNFPTSELRNCCFINKCDLISPHLYPKSCYHSLWIFFKVLCFLLPPLTHKLFVISYHHVILSSLSTNYFVISYQEAVICHPLSKSNFLISHQQIILLSLTTLFCYLLSTSYFAISYQKSCKLPFPTNRLFCHLYQ